MLRAASIVTLCLVVGCGDQTAISPSTTQDAAGVDVTIPTSLATSADGVDEDPVFLTQVPDAIALNVAVQGEQTPVVAWTTTHGVGVARLDRDGELVDEVIDSDVPPFAHPIERPAVGLRPDGTVDLAFTVPAEGGGSVFYKRLPADAPAQPISGTPRPETNLVHLSYDAEGKPLFAWLEDSTLSVAYGDDGPVETPVVDNLTCDCCNPVPVTVGGLPLVAYRDLAHVDGQVVRDVAVVRSTGTFEGFEEPQVIADDHWFLDGCPFSGPSALEANDGALVVAWMDARQSVHPDQTSSTIWVDRSDDGGVTFGTDLAVTSGGNHRWPVMAVDQRGAIHLIWETRGSGGGLSHAVSVDSGRAFSEPKLLVDDSMSRNPTSPSVAIHNDLLLVTWADGGTGHVAGWEISG